MRAAATAEPLRSPRSPARNCIVVIAKEKFPVTPRGAQGPAAGLVGLGQAEGPRPTSNFGCFTRSVTSARQSAGPMMISSK